MRVVHIGFPKTATTFLQKSIFPQLEPEYRFYNKEMSSYFFRPIMDFDDSILDLEKIKSRFDTVWKTHKKTLFSFEPLTGIHYQSAFVNRTMIARRLKEVGFQKVIITIRNQFDALESTYKQYVKSGGVLKFDQYINFKDECPRYLYPEYFDYYPIYKIYKNTFGAGNILVLQYEELKNMSFAADLCNFLDEALIPIEKFEPVNTSLSFNKVRFLRLINHFTYNSFQPSHLISKRFSTSLFHRILRRFPTLSSRSFITKHRALVINKFYEASNRKLKMEAELELDDAYELRFAK